MIGHWTGKNGPDYTLAPRVQWVHCPQLSWNRSHQHSLVGSWTEVSLFDYGNHVDDLREFFKLLPWKSWCTFTWAMG